MAQSHSAFNTESNGILTVSPYLPAEGILNAPCKCPDSTRARTRFSATDHRLASCPIESVVDFDFWRGILIEIHCWPIWKIQECAMSMTLQTSGRSSRPKRWDSFQRSPSRYRRMTDIEKRSPFFVWFCQMVALMRPNLIS